MFQFLHKVAAIQQRLNRVFDRGQSLFLLLIRLYWGGRFFLAGQGKLAHLSDVAQYFDSLGIPAPLMNAWAASLTECIGGLLLALGVASRIVSIPLAGTMIVALATAHRNEMFAIFAGDPSTFLSALPITFLMAALTILVFGPGRFSCDALLASASRGCEGGQTDGNAAPEGCDRRVRPAAHAAHPPAGHLAVAETRSTPSSTDRNR